MLPTLHPAHLRVQPLTEHSESLHTAQGMALRWGAAVLAVLVCTASGAAAAAAAGCKTNHTGAPIVESSLLSAPLLHRLTPQLC